jgi:release factor glutamine methyltransferase
MRHFLVRLLHPILRRIYEFWSRRTRHYHYHGLDLLVMPGVFHPGIFISTRTMVELVETLVLDGRNFLELGAGAGLVALVAGRKGAQATASDISEQALRNLEENARRNAIALHVVRSDLFGSLPQHFDIIAINPPYYPYEPRNEAEKAFFAGSDHGYFTRLFPELARRISARSEVYMVLSDDLDRRPIEALANSVGLHLDERHRKTWLGESQVVFQIVPQASSR